MGICMIPEKEVAGTRLWAVYGHYISLNLGLFSRITYYTGHDILPLESDGFTGVFWEIAYREIAHHKILRSSSSFRYSSPESGHRMRSSSSFPERWELISHLCQKICVVIPKSMTQKSVHSGNFSMNGEIENLVMRFFFPEPFLSKAASISLALQGFTG